MKYLVVDSSSLISLSSNCLLWVLKVIKERFDVQFVITPDVRREIITNSLKIDKFRLGGVRLLKLLGDGTLIVKEDNPSITKEIMNVANKIYFVKGHSYKIIHLGEVSLLSIAKDFNNYILIDERIFSKLIIDPVGLKQLFERRLHMPVVINKDNLLKFKKLVGEFNIIKSSDLIAIMKENDLLKDYIKECYSSKTEKDLVSGSLWALKMNGCAISINDINEYMRILFKKN